MYREKETPAEAARVQSDSLSTDAEVDDGELGSDTVWEGIDGSSLPSDDRSVHHPLTSPFLLSFTRPVSPANNTKTTPAINNEDDGSTVMIEALQDPLLVPIYKGLPELLYVTFIVSAWSVL